jgi:phage terminase Nu1 subunit (DNA packaging protein)
MADSSLDLRLSDQEFPSPPARILNTWKEIAAYLGRGVRTIQRYEEQLGLPIHRPAARGRSAVLAFSDEVERWLRSTPSRNGALSSPTNGGLRLVIVEEIERESGRPELERAKQEMEDAFTAYVRAQERYNALKQKTGNGKQILSGNKRSKRAG